MNRVGKDAMKVGGMAISDTIMTFQRGFVDVRSLKQFCSINKSSSRKNIQGETLSTSFFPTVHKCLYLKQQRQLFSEIENEI